MEFWHVPPMYLAPNDLQNLVKEYDLFTVVRNPYSRVISEYYCQWGGPKEKASTADQFNSWLSSRLDDLRETIESGEKVHGHFTPQHFYCMDNKGNEIVKPENVLKMEELNPSFRNLMSRYGYENRLLTEEKKENTCAFTKKFNASDLSNRNIRAIQKLYKRDFEMFDYDSCSPAPVEVKKAGKGGASSAYVAPKPLSNPTTTANTRDNGLTWGTPKKRALEVDSVTAEERCTSTVPQKPSRTAPERPPDRPHSVAPPLKKAKSFKDMLAGAKKMMKKK